MAKRMLIDANHPEETRVVVLDGNRLEEFDFESSTKKQVKGNIYLAKVTRVEPSLQAAFVDYGGNRHGFLPFSEIHPDYYRIPIGDRGPGLPGLAERDAATAAEEEVEEEGAALLAALPEAITPAASAAAGEEERESGDPASEEGPSFEHEEEMAREEGTPLEGEAGEGAVGEENESAAHDPSPAPAEGPLDGETEAPADSVETIGGDEIEEVQRPRPVRSYKIQEVIKRRQIMLVQVSKEERGNKGAALTTYLSLAGRYCVLMPNTARGGGISRKIASLNDRRRLKDVLSDLGIPEGMGVIVRTAGNERSKAEIKRDYEYLLRLWNEIRDLTLRSTAPALIYEEGNLIKRSIRDLYTRDIGEVWVEGEEGYRTAKAFMKMLVPSHAKRVQPYRDQEIGLLHRYQVESQIDAIHSPTVQLRSGGSVVFNQTEALVAIDVNSGRATRERNIEETALRTNLEAAEEIARQLRLRDLAGLIVIDFIDMEEHKNQGAVERRLKEALKSDRARIQVGRISPFGLLEMSRQRLRPSLAETSTQPCPYCAGTGTVRSTESAALHVLRSIEEEGIRRRSAEIIVTVPTAVALYILNQKRASLIQIEARYGIRAMLARDDALIPPAFRLDRVRPAGPGAAAGAPVALSAPAAFEEEERETAGPQKGEEEEGAEEKEAAGEKEESAERPRRRRRRRPRRSESEGALTRPASEKAGETAPASAAASAFAAPVSSRGADEDSEKERAAAEEGDEEGAERRRRRRGRRGGRRRSRREAPAEQTREKPPAPVPSRKTPARGRIKPRSAAKRPGREEAALDRPAPELTPSPFETVEILPVQESEGPEGEPALSAAGESERAGSAEWPPAEKEKREGAPTSGNGGDAEEEREGEAFAQDRSGAASERNSRVAAPAGVAEAKSEPAYPVLTVKERPAKPRKGWWQRLIPSADRDPSGS